MSLFQGAPQAALEIQGSSTVMKRCRNPAAKFAAWHSWVRIHIAFIKFNMTLLENTRNPVPAVLGDVTPMCLCVPQLGTHSPVPWGSPRGWQWMSWQWHCHPAWPSHWGCPGAAPQDTGAAQLTDKALSPLQSVSHLLQALHALLLCLLGVSFSCWMESSHLLGYMGCWRYLPCQGHTARAGRQAAFIAILHGF